MTRAIGEKQTVALKLEQSAKAVEAQARARVTLTGPNCGRVFPRCGRGREKGCYDDCSGVKRKVPCSIREKAEALPRPARPLPWRQVLSASVRCEVRNAVAQQRRVNVVACPLVLGAQSRNPRIGEGEEFPPLFKPKSSTIPCGKHLK